MGRMITTSSLSESSVGTCAGRSALLNGPTALRASGRDGTGRGGGGRVQPLASEPLQWLPSLFVCFGNAWLCCLFVILNDTGINDSEFVSFTALGCFS